MDVELIGIHRTLHHGLAEAVARGNEHHIFEAGLGINRKHHTGSAEIRAHHLLHARRQRDFTMREAFVDAIRNRAVVVKRGKYMLHCLKNIVDTNYVQKSLLLTCK